MRVTINKTIIIPTDNNIQSSWRVIVGEHPSIIFQLVTNTYLK